MRYTKETATKEQAKRSNKTIVQEINEPAHPEAGTRMKLADNYDDALRQKPGISDAERVTDAKEDKGVAQECLDVQLGRKTPSGGRLGDATTQPNDGVCDTPPEFGNEPSPKNPKDFNSKRLP